MTDLFCLVIPALSTAFVVWQSVRHERERKEWANERAALLERCVPGLEVRAVVDDSPTPPYGTDEYEWKVQEQRRKALGLTDEVI